VAKKAKASQAMRIGRGTPVADLEQVLEMMAKHSVAELEWEASGTRLHLRTHAAFTTSGAPMVMAAPAVHPAPAPLAAPGPASGQPEKPAMPSNQKPVLSPFVGTFYRSSSPGGTPYCKEGQAVKTGDRLCIVEAMKLMNEIEAEFPGKIVQVLVENGQPVEFGEPLFVVET